LADRRILKTPKGEARKTVNWNETMTVKVYEYHDLVKENEKLKQKVTRLEEEIARLKGSASNSVEPVAR
jgi:cell division protein FtsB